MTAVDIWILISKKDEQNGVALLSLRTSTMVTTAEQAAGERFLPTMSWSLMGEEKAPGAAIIKAANPS